jgi:hypothetical protein
MATATQETTLREPTYEADATAMDSVTIRGDELAGVMDALQQYLDNAATDEDGGEPIRTPEYAAVERVIARVLDRVAQG